MDKKTTIQARIKPELRDQAEKVLQGMGMTLSEGIRLFLSQTVNDNALPFQPRLKTPNLETINAIQELEAGKGDSFNDTEELFDSWS